MLRPENFTRAIDWPSLDSAHPKWDKGPLKNFNRENLKFGSKFSVLATITSGLVWEYPHKIFSIQRAARQGHNMGITFGRPAPKIWEGEKTSKIQRDF